MKKIIIDAFDKCRYIYEFVFSILLAIYTYKFFTTKYIEGYWSKTFLVPCAALGIITISIVIYNLYKSNKKIEKIFLSIMIPLGIFYMVFMLPTYAPDESAHIWKAYEVSQGYLYPKHNKQGIMQGTDIPVILIEAKQETLNKYGTLNELLFRNTDYNDTVNVMSPANKYSFVLYIPAAISFFIMRTLNVSVLLGIYGGKLLNFIIFLLGGYYALKKIPFGIYILFTFMFMPMVLQQAVSISADSLINTGLFVYTAYTIALIKQEDKIKFNQAVIYTLLCIFIALTKLPYLPIIGLGLMIFFKKNTTKKVKITAVIVSCLICLAVLGGNYIYNNKLITDIEEDYVIKNNLDAKQQINYLMEKPIRVQQVFMKTMELYGQFYIESCISSPLGWLNIPINQINTITFVFILLFSIVIENNKVSFNIKERIWTLFITIGIVFLVVIGLYITWTPVGAEAAVGVQGRYFIPIILPLLLCFSPKENYIKIKNVEYILPGILVFINAFVIKTLFVFFV